MSITRWQAKSRGGVFGYKIFLFVLRYFGLRSAYFILNFVALYFVFFAPKSTRSLWFYFRKIWKFGRLKSFRSVFKTYHNFGQTIIDKVVIFAGYSNKFTFDSDGREYLSDVINSGTGAILISAHAGNWEAASHFLKRLNTPVNAVLFDGEYEKIKALLSKSATVEKYKTIVIKKDFSHLFEIHKVLKNNELLCIHGDRFLENNFKKTRQIQFLGREARFPVGPFELATRFNKPCLFVFAFKENQTHYQFFAQTAKGQTAEEILNEYVRSVEAMIRKYPTQWFNFYDFWEENKGSL